MHKKALIAALSCLFVSACAIQPLKPSDNHIRAEAPRPATIPQPVRQTTAMPAPKPARKPDTYSVVVTNVPAREILFALARDAKLNVDIHGGLQGNVTLNAIDQTLPQILSRIAKQVDMRYEIDGPNLVVMPDTPFLRTYKVDYVNMSRDTTGAVAIATQLSSPGGAGAPGATGGGTAGGSNNSTTSVANTAKNHFWETLEKNIKDILLETDKEIVVSRRAAAATQAQPPAAGYPPTPASAPAPAAPGTAPTAAGAQSLPTVTGQAQAAQEFKEYQTLSAASVIANPESGVLTVRATSRQHEKIQEFLDHVMTNAKRQVLIEATIVEVKLTDQYQQGIDWKRVGEGGAGGFSLEQSGAGGIPSAVGQSLFVLGYANNTLLGNLTATIRLLETFGTVKVLSSPKISVLNNQTAILKVVDNKVYFTIKADNVATQGVTTTTFTTTPNSIAVGLVMSVTPQISETDTVLLNVRPTVSRIIGFVDDPNPALKSQTLTAPITSKVPEIQTREMESVIKVNSAQIAVMGGLMEDRIDNTDDTVPGLSKLPGIGNLFTHRNNATTKTELVIFLRPVVIKDASIDGDFSRMRALLPDQEFFTKNLRPDGSGDPSIAGGK